MSLTNWLRSARSGATNRKRPSATRLHLECLEDRLTPTFTWGYYPIDEIAPYFAFERADGPGVTADFNDDSILDLFRVSWPHTAAVGSVYLGVGDGPTYVLEESWYIGFDPTYVGVGDLNGDARPDVAMYDFDGVSVGLNDGIWPNTPLLRIDGATVAEGNAGTVQAVFTVTLENGPDQPVSVQYATADNDYGNPNDGATAGSDYQATSGMLTFAPGETSKTITVLVNGDQIPENSENFFVNLSSPTNAVIADRQGVGFIFDDEPHISIAPSVSRAEGNAGQTPFGFAVTLSSASDVPVTVNWFTANGSATGGNDYQAANGTLTFAPGETSKAIAILINGDRTPEPNKTFRVYLNGATNSIIRDGYSHSTGTIIDDEPRISISDVSMKEGNGKKTTQFTFTVTHSAAYDQPVTMSFQTVNGTATTSDNDYVAKTGTLTFAPGETTKTITIEVKGDTKKEANEKFYLDLFGLSSNALFTKNRGTGTILNDD